MRNAIVIDDHFIVTTDNSGGIGEKEQDIVQVSDRLTAYYAARVALLEQWAASANPVAVLLHNFSGADSWKQYKAGVEDLLEEADCSHLPIRGSSETNIELLQSGVAVTMIGKKVKEAEIPDGRWFTYGFPLVGDEVIQHARAVASIKRIKGAYEMGVINRLWPIGSKGILHEVRRLFNNPHIEVDTEVDMFKSSGPSTCVFLHVSLEKIDEAGKYFGSLLKEMYIKN